jgi:hypothetical protein
LRRSGRMTAAQKSRREKLDRLIEYERTGIERSFKDVLDDLSRRWDRSQLPRLALATDEKKEYGRAIAKHPQLGREWEEGRFIHRKVASECPRTKENHLFPVNYWDRELRKDLAMYRRETVCFTRNVANGMMRFAVYSVFHNCLKAYRIVDTARRKEPGRHAEVAGVSRERIEVELSRLFEWRHFPSKIEVEGFARRVWMKDLKTPLNTRQEHIPGYACRGYKVNP